MGGAERVGCWAGKGEQSFGTADFHLAESIGSGLGRAWVLAAEVALATRGLLLRVAPSGSERGVRRGAPARFGALAQ